MFNMFFQKDFVNPLISFFPWHYAKGKQYMCSTSWVEVFCNGGGNTLTMVEISLGKETKYIALVR